MELVRARGLARAWAATVPDARRARSASIFVRRAMDALVGAVAPSTQLSTRLDQPYGRLDRAAGALADTIGEQAGALPIGEALNELTTLYPSLLPASERSQRGAFYTPPVLCDRLLDRAERHGIDWRTARVLDPAAGGGAFLMAAAIRMRNALQDCEPAFVLAQLENRLVGFEIDRHAAGVAQAGLEILLADLAAASKRSVPSFVRVCDTLETTPEANFDLVVGNPPYGRVTLTPEQRLRFARGLYGHANLYGVFTDIAVRWAKPAGVIAFLTPASMLAGQYYSALRGLLAREAPPVEMDFVKARSGVFEDVLQETILAIYKKGAPVGHVQVHHLHTDGRGRAEVVFNGEVALPVIASAPWIAPRGPEHSTLVAHAAKLSSRLRDWGYRVSTGPCVWNRFKPQFESRPGRGRHPVIWAEAVTTDGQFLFRADKRNHAPWFRVEHGDEWLRVDQPCVLVQRTTAKEQARRLIAAELPADFVRTHRGVVVENHLNMVRSSGEARVSLAVLAAVLNSDVADALFRCISGSVAVSAFELEALPLPPPTAMKTVEQLVATGASRAEIEIALREAFGLAERG